MKQLFTNKLTELELKLSNLKELNLDVIEEAVKALELINQAMEELEGELVTKEFLSSKEEIDYYKNQLPQLFQYVHYYKAIINIENERIISCFNLKKEIDFYINCNDNYLKIYLADIELVKYLHVNSNHLDKKYFLLKNKLWRITYLDCSFAESKVFNPVSYNIAKIKALTLVNQFIETKIQSLQEPKQLTPSTLKWTFDKVLLIELVYALYLVGCFNNGKSSLKEIMVNIGNFFTIDLKNHNSIIQNIKARKDHKTKFLVQLKESLMEKIKDE